MYSLYILCNLLVILKVGVILRMLIRNIIRTFYDKIMMILKEGCFKNEHKINVRCLYDIFYDKLLKITLRLFILQSI